MSRIPSGCGRPVLRHLGLAGAMALCLACGGGSSEDGSGGSSGSVTLTGRVPADGSPAASATAVLLFAANGSAMSAPVSGGAFSMTVYPGTALGMVFAGSSRQFLGYLSLGDGISSLPLTKVASGVGTIDLGTLTASGPALIPANNPVTSGQLPLTAAEQAAFAQCNGLFAGVVQDPDVDRDGVIDLLEGRFYHPFVSYWIDGGHFGGRQTASVDSGVAIRNWNLTLVDEGGSDGTSATVTGPAGSGISGRPCTVAAYAAQTSYSVFPDLSSSTTVVPVSGTYVFNPSLGRTLSITVPDQSGAGRRTLVAVPTVTVSSAHTIYSVSWACQTLDGQSIASPESVLHNLVVGIDRGAGNRVYTSSALDASVTSQVIPSGTTIPWDSSICVTLEYTDAFLNYYVAPFYNSY
jgi:hypothetical protein